jgi:hypothetical protein
MPDQTSRAVAVPLNQHECMGDRMLRLTGRAIGRGPVVYHCDRGYVATLPNGLALSGFYPTERAARDAQMMYQARNIAPSPHTAAIRARIYNARTT